MLRQVGAIVRAAILLVVLALATTARADDEPAFTVTKAPSLVTFVPARYPEAKQAAGIEAEVTLTVDVDASGKVSAVEVAVSAGLEFDAAAKEAASHFVFSPGEVDGKPAPVRITYRYAFKITTQLVRSGPQVNFEGVVKERFSKRPLAGVRVWLKDLAVAATTDAAGAFAFVDVPLGPHMIELSADKLVTVTTEETIEAGKKKTVTYRVEERVDGVDEERVTRAPRIKKESVTTTIRTEEARRVPGTQGDTLKVVQNLPGVARAALGSGALIVWGAAPRETKVNLDGVEIPTLYHLGGLRSTVNGALVRSIELVPGGYGADYGRGLGGLVRIETRALPDRGVHGYAQADAIDASAMVTGAIGSRVRVGVAARYSYLDAVLRAITRRTGSGDVTKYVPIPRYYDYQLRLDVKLRRDETLEAIVIASNDRLERNLPSDDPTDVRIERTEQTFYRAIVRYQRLLSDGSSVSVTPSFGWEASDRRQQFGLVPVQQSTTAYSYGLRAAYRRKVATWATLSAGLDLRGAWQDTARSGSLTQPPREGDLYVFGQAPGDDVSADRWKSHIVDVAPYVFAELRVGKLTITPGLRVDVFYLEGDRTTPPSGGLPPVGYARISFAADPRLQIIYQPHRRVTLTAAVGLYHQTPDAEDLSPVFGNPTLGPSSALHVSLGAQVRITPTLSCELVGYYKRLDDLPVRSSLPTPALSAALVQEGQGRSYGGQLLLRQELTKGLFGWITYSVSRSERLDHPDGSWRLFDYDQTHALTAVLSYEYRHFTFGARFRWSSGYPRTPVIASYYDPRGDKYQPVFGRQNSSRLPDFLQLDVRVEKTIAFRRATLDIYLDAQNITARANPEEIVYGYDYRRKGYITGLPVLATLGLKVEW